MSVRIGTRGSDLALWQARHVSRLLGADHTLVIIKTRGDQITDVPLQAVDGRAFFTAEIEQALLDRTIDVAVHSLKDLTVADRPGLALAAVLPRGPVHEMLLVSPHAYDPGARWMPLRKGATVGTSAPRRAAQLAAVRPDVRAKSIRGNVPTRVQLARNGTCDAVLLAAAGLERLGLDTSPLHAIRLPATCFVPAPGQGALAVQTRDDDQAVLEMCRATLHDEATAALVAAERSVLTRAGGGCNVPLGAWIERRAERQYRAYAFLGHAQPDGATVARWAEADGASPEAAAAQVWTRLENGQPTGQGPLGGTRVVVVGVQRDGSVLADRLTALGADVRLAGVLSYQDIAAPAFAERVAALRPGDAVTVTSQHTAQYLAGVVVPAGVTVGAVGETTARVLRAIGWQVDVTGDGGAADLAAALGTRAGHTVLFPGAEDARPDLVTRLEVRGVRVERVVVYRLVPAAHVDAAPPQPGEIRIYASPSAVRAALALGWEPASADVRRIAMGDATAQALATHGLTHEADAAAGPEAALAVLAAEGEAA